MSTETAATESAPPFIDPQAVAHLSAEARALMQGLFAHVRPLHRAILTSAPGSRERAQLMADLYAGAWEILERLDAAGGVDTGYHSAAGDRAKDAAALVRLCPPPGRVLEIGCGGGALCGAMARAGYRVDGVDLVPGPDWSVLARQGVRFYVGDALTLCLTGDYDLVVMDNALEHVPPGDYEAILQRVRGLLRPGGWYVALVPNRLTGPWDCSRPFLPRGQPAEGGHFRERRLSELVRDLRAAGFDRITTTAYASLAAGRRFGWSRAWLVKALVAEAVFAALLVRWREPRTFGLMVPAVVAGRV